VTHAGIARVVLTHYMGAPLAQYHRLRVTPGSVSVLSFGQGQAAPRVLAINWKGSIREVL
jgi:broad specificity phosphatase PhoE